MIRNSTLSLTQADACIAIAHWLNATTFREPVKVTAVRPDDNRNSSVTHFEIEIAVEPTPETNDPQGN